MMTRLREQAWRIRRVCATAILAARVFMVHSHGQDGRGTRDGFTWDALDNPNRPRGSCRAALWCASAALLLSFAAPPAVSAVSAGDEPDPLPGLDEMLGLDDAPARDDGQHGRELERKLTAREAAEALQQAVQLMDDTADRLSTPDGAGLVTQRLQEDIIRKLDRIIDSAKKNNNSSSSSASSDGQSSQGQQGRPARQRSGGQQSSGRGDNTGQISSPARQDAVLGPDTLTDPASWGALPDRLRDALRQGVSGTFSSAYRRLTEKYYKKLAEQAGGER